MTIFKWLKNYNRKKMTENPTYNIEVGTTLLCIEIIAFEVWQRDYLSMKWNVSLLNVIFEKYIGPTYEIHEEK